jgi:hypothetical protein
VLCALNINRSRLCAVCYVHAVCMLCAHTLEDSKLCCVLCAMCCVHAVCTYFRKQQAVLCVLCAVCCVAPHLISHHSMEGRPQRSELHKTCCTAAVMC